MSNIFEKRVAFKPFEYPEIEQFKHSINHSYWLISEWNFVADIQDFQVKLNSVEQSAIKNALLAISQIEISVKRFWGDLGNRFPKAEFEQVGFTFGESEVRHADAYSHLLQVLGLNEDFAQLLTIPAIQGRVDYLTKYIKGAAKSSNEDFALTLALFSIFIENVSLFSQFAIIKSFNKHRNLLKDVDNVVQATQKEESIHAALGISIIRHIKAENPHWFTPAFYTKVNRAAKKAYEAECNIIDWIFTEGDLPFVSKAALKEFIKSRFNESVQMIGGSEVFKVDQDVLSELRWFIEELHMPINSDFFNKRSVDYAKKQQSITSEDLF